MLTAGTNAVGEELFFRGALWSAVQNSHPMVTTTIAYTATTAATRNPALVLAGAVTSVLFGLQRRTSGGVLAPSLAHVTWSLLMLRYLPPLFRAPPPGSPGWIAARRLPPGPGLERPSWAAARGREH